MLGAGSHPQVPPAPQGVRVGPEAAGQLRPGQAGLLPEPLQAPGKVLGEGVLDSAVIVNALSRHRAGPSRSSSPPALSSGAASRPLVAWAARHGSSGASHLSGPPGLSTGARAWRFSPLRDAGELTPAGERSQRCREPGSRRRWPSAGGCYGVRLVTGRAALQVPITLPRRSFIPAPAPNSAAWAL